MNKKIMSIIECQYICFGLSGFCFGGLGVGFDWFVCFTPNMLCFYSFFLELMLFYLFPTEKCKSMTSQEGDGNFKRYI